MITKEISLFLLQWRSLKNPSELKTDPSLVSSSVINIYDLVQNFASQRQMPWPPPPPLVKG